MLVNMEEVLVYSLMGCNGARQYTFEQNHSAPHLSDRWTTHLSCCLTESVGQPRVLFILWAQHTRSAGKYDRRCEHTAKARFKPTVAHHSDSLLGASVGSTAITTCLGHCFGV